MKSNSKLNQLVLCFLFCLTIIPGSTSGGVIRDEEKPAKWEVEDEEHMVAGTWLRVLVNQQKFAFIDAQSVNASNIDSATNNTTYSALSDELNNLFNATSTAHLRRSKRAYDLSDVFDGGWCALCKAAITLVEGALKISSSEGVREILVRFCKIKLSDNVCEGAGRTFTPVLFHVLKHTKMETSEVCAWLLGDLCHDEPSPEEKWDVQLPAGPKPRPRRALLPKNGKTFKILQLADTHFDPLYQEGSNAECGEPLCCRSTNGPASSPEDAAGKWGDYRKCDMPKRTLEHMFKDIRRRHPDIAYIIWTGDIPPHNIWNQSREENSLAINHTVDEIKRAFRHQMIYPVLGNHENAPVNVYPPLSAESKFSVSWLYNELHDHWKHWLGKDIPKTVKRGAFYMMQARDGLRIISINTNFCSNFNVWLMLESIDPSDHLKWLIDQLLQAEIAGDKVHIIGHIPPGSSDCLKIWSANYYKIINRFESTVAAQFFGHTHWDEFEVFYDLEDMKRAISVAYVAPSVTPYDAMNPGYRIYYIDDEGAEPTRMVVDHETWIMDLNVANRNPNQNPTWSKLYSALRNYEMESLHPQNWDALIFKMADDPATFNQYYRYYYKGSPARPKCDLKCKKRLLCDLLSGRSRDREFLCARLVDAFESHDRCKWEYMFKKVKPIDELTQQRHMHD